MRTPSTERIDQLALVWLLVPSNKGPAEFAKQLKTVVPGADDRTRLVAECAARLRERGMIHPQWFQLNDVGRNEALNVLGVPRKPESKVTWQWAKSVLLLRSLGLEPTPVAIKAANRAADLVPRILARRYNLDRKVETSVKKVVAVLVRRALGLEETHSFKAVDAFPAAFLNAAPPAELEAESINGHSAPPPSAVQLKLADCKLPDFASQVTDAARSVVSGRWHGAVFISHVWKTLNARGDVGITFKDFKRRLVEAHQKELVELSRADLVEAMPAEEVSESETVHAGSGARFHFIRIEQLAS